MAVGPVITLGVKYTPSLVITLGYGIGAAPAVADKTIPSWYYTPGPGLGAIDAAVKRELDRISQATRGAAPYVQLQVLAVAPDRPRKGMMVYADGTNWNPGSGAGVYVYSGTAWVQL